MLDCLNLATVSDLVVSLCKMKPEKLLIPVSLMFYASFLLFVLFLFREEIDFKEEKLGDIVGDGLADGDWKWAEGRCVLLIYVLSTLFLKIPFEPCASLF